MPAALAFIVIPAKAGIQRRANPTGTTRQWKCNMPRLTVSTTCSDFLRRLQI